MSATGTLDDRIDEIRSRVDLAAEVERRAGQAFKHNGGVLTYSCPNPAHEDRNPSFTVTITGAHAGTWHCWSACDESGDIIDLLVWLDGITKAEAIERLAEQIGRARDASHATTARPESNRSRATPATPQPDPEVADRLLTEFVAGRRWELDVCRDELDLRVVADRRGSARVRFPFRRAGQIVYWQDRAIGAATPKWLSRGGAIPGPYEMDRLATARTIDPPSVFLIEGLGDLVALVHAFPHAAAVACPGAGVLKEQWAPAFTALQVYVIADNDPGGQSLRSRADRLLGPVATGVRHAHVPEHHNDLDAWRQADPDHFGEHLLEVVDQLSGPTVTPAGG